MIGVWPSKYFKPEEVLSPGGLKQLSINNNCLLQLKSLSKLDAFREFVDKPLFINHAGLKYRGYRSALENMKIQGASYSRHCQGVAFDISCPELNITELYLKAVDFGWGGIGYYQDKNFIHCDDRDILPNKDRVILKTTWRGDIEKSGLSYSGSLTLDLLKILRETILI